MLRLLEELPEIESRASYAYMWAQRHTDMDLPVKAHFHVDMERIFNALKDVRDYDLLLRGEL